MYKPIVGRESFLFFFFLLISVLQPRLTVTAWSLGCFKAFGALVNAKLSKKALNVGGQLALFGITPAPINIGFGAGGTRKAFMNHYITV